MRHIESYHIFELHQDTYRKAGKELSDIGHVKRGKKLIDYADELKDKEEKFNAEQDEIFLWGYARRGGNTEIMKIKIEDLPLKYEDGIIKQQKFEEEQKHRKGRKLKWAPSYNADFREINGCHNGMNIFNYSFCPKSHYENDPILSDMYKEDSFHIRTPLFRREDAIKFRRVLDKFIDDNNIQMPKLPLNKLYKN